MKKPKVERGPNVSMPIRQPHTTITSGVRQVATEAGRSSPRSRPCHSPMLARRTRRLSRDGIAAFCSTKLMHQHGNPNGIGANLRRNAALQIAATA